MKITREPGRRYLETLTAYVEPLEKAFQIKDDAALSSIFGAMGPLYKRVQPYVLDKQLGDTLYETGNVCLYISQRLKTTGMTLQELAIFEKEAATKITALLPKKH